MNCDRFKFRVWDSKTARYLDCHNSPMIGMDRDSLEVVGNVHEDEREGGGL